MTLDFDDRVDGLPPAGRAGSLPAEPLRDEIDEVMLTDLQGRQQRRLSGRFRRPRSGPTSAAYRRLFKRLDWLTERLAGQRFLVGDTITEADVRLFTTLARFDPVYHGHFKCNRPS